MEITIPPLSENLSSGTIVKIFIKEGDRIKKDQPLLELETEKAVAVIPSPHAGVVEKIYLKEGAEARVGQAILSLSPESPEEVSPKTEATALRQKETEKKSPPLAASPKAPENEKEEAPTDRGEAEKEPSSSGLPPAAAPSVRTMAFQLGIDLRQIPGTARGGRITIEDLKAYIEKLQKSAGRPAPGASPTAFPVAELPDFSSWGPIRKESASLLRRTIARKMAEAWSSSPRVTQFDEADISDLMKAIKRYAPAYQKQGAHLTLTGVLLKALILVLKEYPAFNASWDASRGEIIFKEYYHLGVAVDTKLGLMVPVIRDVDQKDLLEISRQLNALAIKAKDRTISTEEMHGGTFTVTNQGAIGGGHFTPIINVPEVAILGVGRATLRPVIKSSKILPRSILPLSLSYDHRILDGAHAARFLRTLSESLEKFDASALKLERVIPAAADSKIGPAVPRKRRKS